MSFGRALFARGRLKAGEMNKTEAEYAKHLELRKRAGEVLWYRFESLKVKVANDRCWYTPDFVVMLANGDLELHEVKGARAIFQEDAIVKCKVVASEFPFRLIVCYPSKRDAGGWKFEEF